MASLVFWCCTYAKSRSQWPCGLRRWSAAARLLRSWVRIPPGHGCLSVVSVVCSQVEVSATNWSLVQRSPTDYGASLCVIEKPQEWGGHDPRWVAAPQQRKKKNICKECIMTASTEVLLLPVSFISWWFSLQFTPVVIITPNGMNADLMATCVRRTPDCFQRCWFFVVYGCVVLRTRIVTWGQP